MTMRRWKIAGVSLIVLKFRRIGSAGREGGLDRGTTALALRSGVIVQRRSFAAARQQIEGGKLRPSWCRSCPLLLGQLLDAGGTGDALPFGLQHADAGSWCRRSGD